METRLARRAFLTGGAAGVALVQFPINIGEAAIWIPRAYCRRPEIQPVFWPAFLSGVASIWVAEALKNYGLVPGAHAAVTSSVAGHHANEDNMLSNQGYNTDAVYSGPYSGGDIAVSGAQQGDNYLAFNTSDHSTNTCTVQHHIPDIYAMNAVTRVLERKGYPTHRIQASALPIHGDHSGNYDELGHTATRTSMTPNGGEIKWSARHNGEKPVVNAELRSPDINANVTAIPNGKNWMFTYDAA